MRLRFAPRMALGTALLLLLVACASMPLATLWKLRDFGPETLATVDPAAVRVAGRLEPGPLRIDPARSRLQLELQPRGGGAPERIAFGLRPARVVASGLADPGWQVFELDAAGQAAMARLRPALATRPSPYERGAFSFNFHWDGELPPEAGALVASVRLQLDPRQPPLVLFDRARIRIDRTP